MKKISMFLMASALVMMFACNNNSSTTEEETTDSTATEAPAPAADAASADVSALLDQYVSTIEEMLPLYEPMSSGDSEAAKKLMEMSQKLQEIQPVLQNSVSSMTPEQRQKYEDASNKIVEAVQKTKEKQAAQ